MHANRLFSRAIGVEKVLDSVKIKYSKVDRVAGEQVARKPKVYIESTIPSYLVSRPSRDILTLAHQQVTKIWWETAHDKYDIYISQVVIDEINAGDKTLAKQRADILKGIQVLKLDDDIQTLADEYVDLLKLPGKALRDALHMAVATKFEIDYLVTWNSAHIANEYIRRKLQEYNTKQRRKTPMICTPEELINPETHI